MAGRPELRATKSSRLRNEGLLSLEAVSEPLPQELKSLFWDVEFQRLRWEHDRDLIIGRVLAEGGWQHAHWLVQRVGKGAIRAWIVRRRGRGLSARTLRFWEVVVDLPHRHVSTWIAEQMAYPWSKRVAG